MGLNIKKIICNNFAGIRNRKADFSSSVISAKDMQNVELYNTAIGSGVGIRTTKGNVSISSDLIPSDEKIVNIFQSVQCGKYYFFVHTISSTEGKLYLFDMINNILIPKITGLSLTNESFGVDFAQGESDLFVFANGKDNIHTIEINALNPSDEIMSLEIQDREGNEIKGRLLEVYDGRLWCCVGKRLYWSVQANIYDWATSDIEVATSAGFVDFVKEITAIKPYLSALAVFFKDSSLLITGEYPYSATDNSPGGCASANSLVFHGTDLFFYDHTKKGIFSFQQVVLGNKTLGDNIAVEIQSELEKIDATRLDEIRTLSVVMKERNEIWFYLPTTDLNYSTILIYDYLHKEWIKRVSNKVFCFCMYDGALYSGGKKIYKELQGNTFDGEFIQSYYKCSAFNNGSNTTIKALYYEPKLTMGVSLTNNFWIKYSKNYDYLKPSRIRKVKSKYKNFLVWGEGVWNTNFWNILGSSAITRLPRISAFKILELEIYNTQINEDFNIKSLEFSEIEVYQS